MYFRQVVHEDLGCASYLVGDPATGVAAVVDPQLHVEPYLELARHAGLRIEHVLETHNHADHVSGHSRLAEATGATVHVHARAEARYPHAPLHDGTQLVLGDLVLRALHTPGHRPEHTAFVLADRDRGDAPWAVLTGDSLFVGDVARPDLAIDPGDGTRELHRSLHERLLRLPDHVEVWPGHLGGSECGGAGMSLKPASTIGFERAHSPLLALADVDAFTAALTQELGDKPPSVERVVAANVAPFAVADETARPLTPHALAARAGAGALVVDVRTAADHDAAHVPGSVSNPVGVAGFGAKLGWLAAGGRPLVVVAEDDEQAALAARHGAAAGVAVAGHLAGGWSAWRAEGRPTERFDRIPAAALRDRDDLQRLDVRRDDEARELPVPGAVQVPWNALGDTVPDGLDARRPIAVLCASGQRAGTAAGLLRRAGATSVVHVVDGGARALAG